MAWTIKYTSKSKKQLRKLDRRIASAIIEYMGLIAQMPDPTKRGRGLEENLSGFWRYRVADYRIICNILQDEIVIVVVKIGHRRDVYTKRK